MIDRDGKDGRPRTRRKVRRIASCLALLALVGAGPNAFFYFKWMYPDKPLPPVADGRIDQRMSSEAVAAARFGDVLRASREEAGLPSLSAAIGYEGRVQWAGAVGFADIESRTPATVSYRYRLGSTSKALTGVLLVRLADAGVIRLDAPISSYLQGMPKHLSSVTARQLVSHQAGVRHYAMPGWWLGWWEMYSAQPFHSVDEGLSLFLEDRLLFEPGKGFRYSTFGYSLLSRLMEGATGIEFPQLVDEQLFQPAGMGSSGMDSVTPMPESVSFYSADADRYTKAYPTDTSYKMAGGGMVSTPTDLVKLGVCLFGNDLVSDSGKKLLWTPLALADGSPNPENYAMGWRVDTSRRLLGADRPTLIYHHGGSQAGGAAFFMMVPEYDIVVAVVSNSGTRASRASVQETAYELVRRAVARKDEGLGQQ